MNEREVFLLQQVSLRKKNTFCVALIAPARHSRTRAFFFRRRKECGLGKDNVDAIDGVGGAVRAAIGATVREEALVPEKKRSSFAAFWHQILRRSRPM